MQKLKKSLRKANQSGLIRNSSILLSGNVVGQAIALLATPVITRLYSDAEMGILATILSVAGLLGTLATGRYEESIVVAREKKDAKLLFSFSFKLLTVISLLSFGLLFLAKDSLFPLFKWEAIRDYWHYIPLIVWTTGVYALFSNAATRERKFAVMAKAGMLHNIINAALKIVFGFLSFTRIGLILSSILSTLSSFAVYVPVKEYFRDTFRHTRKDEYRVALEYKEFPTYNLGRTFLSFFSYNLPFLVLPGFFGEAKLGLFSLSIMLLYRPIQLFSTSIFSTFFENTNTLIQNKQPILPGIRKYWKVASLLFLPLFVIAGVVAIPVFGFVFDHDWAESGIYFQYLLPWMFMMIMVYPLHYIPIVFRQQNKAMLLEATQLVFRILAIVTGIHYGDFKLTILLFSAVSTIFSIIQLIWFYRLLKQYEEDSAVSL